MVNIEETEPSVKYSGLNTDKAADFDSTLNVQGAVTLQSTLAVTGVATFTAAPVFTAGTTTPAIQVPDGAAYTVLAANSGKLHLVLNQAQDATLTLPTAAAGLQFSFISTMEAADGHDWIIDTGSDTNFFKGGLIFNDSDAADGIDLLSAPDGDSNSILQVNLPSVSTVVNMYCDATNWFIWGRVFSTTAPAFSDQA